MTGEKANDFRHGRHEVLCQFRKWRFANYDEQANVVTDHGFKFVRLVADSRVMGYCYPSFGTNNGEPLFIGACRLEMVTVALDA